MSQDNKDCGFKIEDIIQAVTFLKDRGHKDVKPFFTHGQHDQFQDRIMRFKFDGGQIDIYRDFEYQAHCLYKRPKITEEKDLPKKK